MNPHKESVKWRLYGGIFQMPMIIVWAARGIIFSVGTTELTWKELFTPNINFSSGDALQLVGLGLMCVCMVRIYKQPKDTRNLITTDVFTLTRHPMYHGMFIADFAHFFTADLTRPLFWISWILFTFLLLAAGWFQEKETLARWQKDAEKYYAATPRFAFEWIWFWYTRNKYRS